MATLTLSYPDAQANRIIDALCDAGGWTAADGPRPAFSKKVVADQIRQQTLAYEADKARRDALAAVVAPTTVDIA